MKKSTIGSIEKTMDLLREQLEELKNKPILSKEETRRLIRKKRQEYTKFTQAVRNKYHQKGDDVESLAKGIKVSESFAKHILRADIVPVSERVIAALAKRYNLSFSYLRQAAKERNAIGREYYSKRRQKAS